MLVDPQKAQTHLPASNVKWLWQCETLAVYGDGHYWFAHINKVNSKSFVMEGEICHLIVDQKFHLGLKKKLEEMNVNKNEIILICVN